MNKSLCLMIVLGVLVACERAPSPEDQAAPLNPNERLSDNATAEEMEKLEKQRPLNMALPTEAPMDPRSHSDLQADYTKRKSLPDLFKESEKQSEGRTKIGGKLITEEGGEDYLDSVKGAEVKIEVKMK